MGGREAEPPRPAPQTPWHCPRPRTWEVHQFLYLHQLRRWGSCQRYRWANVLEALSGAVGHGAQPTEFPCLPPRPEVRWELDRAKEESEGPQRPSAPSTSPSLGTRTAPISGVLVLPEQGQPLSGHSLELPSLQPQERPSLPKSHQAIPPTGEALNIQSLSLAAHSQHVQWPQRRQFGSEA